MYSYPQYILKYVVIMTALCISHCPVIYREEDLLDIAPLLAENSRLGNTIYIHVISTIQFYCVYERMPKLSTSTILFTGIFS